MSTSRRLLPIFLAAAVMPLAGPTLAHASTGHDAHPQRQHRVHHSDPTVVLERRSATSTKSGALVSA